MTKKKSERKVRECRRRDCRSPAMRGGKLCRLHTIEEKSRQLHREIDEDLDLG